MKTDTGTKKRIIYNIETLKTEFLSKQMLSTKNRIICNIETLKTDFVLKTDAKHQKNRKINEITDHYLFYVIIASKAEAIILENY